MKTQVMNGLISITGILIITALLSCNKDDNPVSDTNHPPAIPTIDGASGSPGHQSNSQPISTTIYWICSDLDGDNLTYDVYFGSTTSPTLKQQGIAASQYTPGTLQYSSTYYWKIVAHDGNGANTQSPVWRFATIAKPSETVTIPSIPTGPSSSSTGQTLSYSTGNASSSLGHSIEYRFDWGDGILSTWKSSTAALHSWNASGGYNVRSQARCATHKTIVSSWSSSKQITISTPQNPVLVLSTGNLDFGLTTTPKSFIVTNGGTGTLTWTISDNKQWIQVSPVSGSTTSELDQVSISVNRSGLGCGTYTGVVTVSSNGGNKNITVNMQVTGSSQLVFNPTGLDFGSDKTKLSVHLTNSNPDCGSINWTASSSTPWLSISPTSGTTTTESDEVFITVDRSSLPPNNYTGSVVFTSNGVGRAIPVALSVACGLRVISPSTGSVWNKGVLKTISWDPSTIAGNVKLELYKGSTFLCSISSSTSNDGIFNWTVNDCGQGTRSDYRIKVTNLNSSNCFDFSNSFTISAKCQITVTDPTSSSSWTKGARHEIRWDPSMCSAPNVEIILAKGQTVDTLKAFITTSTFNDGMYSWIVDDFGNGTSPDYRIYINDSDNRANGGRSSKFTIVNDAPKTITLNATADSDISSNFPDLNVGSSSSMLVGKTTSDGWLQSYVRFGGLMSSVPSGATILSAKLVLTRRAWVGSLNMQVTSSKRNWLESTITWNTQPGEVSSTQTIVSPNGGGNPSVITIDVTPHVQDWISGIRLNYGFVLGTYGATAFDNAVDFYTKESSTSSYRPKLTVTYKSP